jgi:hypothetical protein
MLYRVVHEEPQLHGVPDALAPLIRACLAKDPEERPSTLQLSLRLKEIAAREAQGLPDVRPPAPRGDPNRPTGRLPEDYGEQRTQRRQAHPRPKSDPATTQGPGGGGAARPGTGRSPVRPRPGRDTRTGGRQGTGKPTGRQGAGPAPARTTGTGRRPANPRLLRQRLIVFVVVTLLVALGIAAAQGCQGPSRGLPGTPAPRHTAGALVAGSAVRG